MKSMKTIKLFTILAFLTLIYGCNKISNELIDESKLIRNNTPNSYMLMLNVQDFFATIK